MTRRALWHPLSVSVVEILPSTPAHHREWLTRRLAATPRKGGITLTEGPRSTVLASWREASELLEQRIQDQRSRAAELDGTATGRYHAERAARWALLRGLLHHHRATLWPAECGV